MLAGSLLFLLTISCNTKDAGSEDTSSPVDGLVDEEPEYVADGVDGSIEEETGEADGVTPDDGPADGSDMDAGTGDSDAGDSDTGDSGTVVPPPDLLGFIGSACESDLDCPFDGGVCLTEGFPDGHCSVACELYCPDLDGYPVTFCVDGDDLPDSSLEGGWCVSRCSFGAYPEGGCREEYGCSVETRHSEPGTEMYACMPGAASDLSECHQELVDRGVGFEPTVRTIDFPDGRPDKECEIIDPVWVESPVFGVELKYYDGEPTPRVLASCDMAHALADTIEDVAPYGVSALRHIGTYNCRMIAGTDMLSEHSFASAIDIYGFDFDDERLWTLEDHWEHDTTAPSTDAGRFLYESAHRWYDDWIWNIILTPNYNVGHDNHFHVDLKEGFHDLSMTSGRYIGPAPYVD
jgi:hypothetical protein